MTLPIPVDQRAVLAAIYDLASDHIAWTGPARRLAEQMTANGHKCAPGTATRRAKRAAESGYLDVELKSGRPGSYRITCLSAPKVAVSALSTDDAPPTWSELRATARRCMTLLVALVLGSPRRSAPSAQPARRRRYPVLPDQLSFDFAQSAEAPIAEVSAQQSPSSAPSSAPNAVSLQDVEVSAPRAAAEDPSMACHSIVPSPCPTPPQLNPIVPLHGGDGASSKLRKWWGNDITREQLKDPGSVELLYRQATAAGEYPASEQMRLAFFGFASYTLRVSTRNPGGFFVKQLGQPGKTKPGMSDIPFAARLTMADSDWARSAIKSVDHPPAAAETQPAASGTAYVDKPRPSTLGDVELAAMRSRYPNLVRTPPAG